MTVQASLGRLWQCPMICTKQNSLSMHVVAIFIMVFVEFFLKFLLLFKRLHTTAAAKTEGNPVHVGHLYALAVNAFQHT